MYSRVEHRADLPDWLALHVEYQAAAQRASCELDVTTEQFLPENWWARQAQILLHAGVFEDPRPPGGYRKPPGWTHDEIGR